MAAAQTTESSGRTQQQRSWIRVQSDGPQAEEAIKHQWLYREYTLQEVELQGLQGEEDHPIQLAAAPPPAWSGIPATTHQEWV